MPFQSWRIQLKEGNQFFEKSFRFLENMFQSLLKMFKIFTAHHGKICRFLKRRAILEIPSTAF